MLKKTIKYEDYNGNEVEEDFYFNLTKTELVEANLTTAGGLDETINKIVKTKDVPGIAKIFKQLVLKAYGVKSEDGKRFMKGPEISRSFEESPAYDILFTELTTSADAASAFIKGLMPKDLQTEIEKEQNAIPGVNK